MLPLLALSSAVLIAAATPPPSKAQQQRAAQIKNSAPADEYFGRMKLSYLGINNTFRDEATRAGDHTTNEGIIARVGFAEDALRAWQHKYPKDPQLPRSIFLSSRVNLKIWTTPAQWVAAYDLVELRDKFGTTYFGKQARAELKKGYTMHVAAVAQPCAPDQQPVPIVTPTPMPTAAPQYNISVNAMPVPCLTPTPSPTPAPTNTPAFGPPTPTPSTSPGPGLSPTPTPSTSPGPSLSPTPTPSTSPGPSVSPTPFVSASAVPR